MDDFAYLVGRLSHPDHQVRVSTAIHFGRLEATPQRIQALQALMMSSDTKLRVAAEWAFRYLTRELPMP